jgi:hypothetical protein
LDFRLALLKDGYVWSDDFDGFETGKPTALDIMTYFEVNFESVKIGKQGVRNRIGLPMTRCTDNGMMLCPDLERIKLSEEAF